MNTLAKAAKGVEESNRIGHMANEKCAYVKRESTNETNMFDYYGESYLSLGVTTIGLCCVQY